MAVFPKLLTENIVQIGDQTRLDASASFATQNENPIEQVWIKPLASGSFVKVYDNTDTEPAEQEDWVLDWAYAAAGTITATVRVVIDASNNDVDFTLDVISAADDKLLSSDQDLTAHEPDILKWVRNGRSSFLAEHRMARDRILAYLDEQRIWDEDRNRFTKDSLTDVLEFKEWSKFETLAMIFEGISNALDDIFAEKAATYRELRDGARSRGAIRIDRDNDGNTDDEKIDMRSGLLVRR